MQRIVLGLAAIAVTVATTPALANATVAPSFDQHRHPGSVAVQRECPTRNTDRYSKAILASKPSAYYRLDESSGPVLCDASRAHLNGTYASAGITYRVAGPLRDGTNKAVRSAGQPGDVGVGGTPSISGAHSFTLEGWFKKTSKLQNQVLTDIGQAGMGNIAGLATWSSKASTSPITTCPHLASSAMALDSYGSSNCWNTAAAGVNLWDGKWHYLALVYNAANVKVTAYVDGKSLGSQTPEAGPLHLQASPIRIGNWVDTVVNQPFIGAAADTAVYPRALSSATILAHWRAAA